MKNSASCVKAKCGKLLLLYANFVRRTIDLIGLYKFDKKGERLAFPFYFAEKSFLN